MQIALIPIDNRPVCYQLPEYTVKLAKENKIFLPDISLMGDLTKNADTEAILDWLSGINNIDVVVISLDTIAYGGLIPSRRSTYSFEIIKERIDKLVEILKKQQVKVYAFSSIMRISNNNVNEEEKEYWKDYGKKLFEYSYNCHKYATEGKSAPETDVPPEIIKDYLETRKRNFKINKYYIELYKQGIFDTLVFSKDDCARYGFNVEEADILKELSKDKKGIYIKTGADEIPLSLLSRALNKDKKIKIAPVYTKPDSIDRISKYEDISVKESVEGQIELAGGVLSDEKNCDLIMLVNNFQTEQGELVMGVSVPMFEGQLILPEKPYFIADILNANGSDNNFVKELFKHDTENFYGYSAWNTTGNTLGSCISCALTYFGAKEQNEHDFKRLQLIRFLDDWAYQANVRAKIRNNPENLVNNAVYDEMKQFENMLTRKFNIKEAGMKYSFPWNRFFEIKISE